MKKTMNRLWDGVLWMASSFVGKFLLIIICVIVYIGCGNMVYVVTNSLFGLDLAQISIVIYYMGTSIVFVCYGVYCLITKL